MGALMTKKIFHFIKGKLPSEVPRADIIHFKYFPIISTLFSAIIIASNVAAIKLIDVFGITLTGGFIIYPFVYTLSCILVEVYGYKNARLAIWCAFILSFIFLFCIDIVALLPPSPTWDLNDEFIHILMPQNRIILASLISFIVSDFLNSYLIARSKKNGCSLLKRIIKASYLVIFVNIIIFIGLAFYGTVTDNELLNLMFFAFIKKIMFQLLLLPITAWIIETLKNIEGIDLYDYDTNFTPFSLENVYDLNQFRIKKENI